MMKNHSTPSTPPPHRFSLRHLRVKASLGTAAAVTTLLVACGGDSGGESEASPVSNTSPTPAASTPTTTPTKPATTPTKPVTTPTKPATTPTKPVTTPTKPVTTPSKPVVVKAPSRLNDTGITKCATADGSNNKADCSTAVSNATGGQVPLGQDGHYGTGMNGSTGMVFEKVAGFEGKCVQDKHTGLMWEVKQTDGGLHDTSHTYTWYSTTNNGGYAGRQNGGTCKGSNCDTAAFVAAVNAAGWCGHSDWRLPTREELRSIVDYSRINPAIDTAYFPHTKYTNGNHYWYWSSSPYAYNHYYYGYDYRAWLVTFTNGSSVDANKINSKSFVRLVRGRQ